MRLIVENLAAERGGATIFSRVGFSLVRGGSLVVTGPNGSGKSTLLRVVASLLPASRGTVRLEGADAEATVPSVTHYLGHENAMKTALTVTENLAFWQKFLGDPLMTIGQALEVVGLSGTGHLPFGYLSTGQRRRAAIARMLVSRRDIWLVDEPTAGLDAASEARFAGIMADHVRGGGILIAATHQPLGLDGAMALEMGEV